MHGCKAFADQFMHDLQQALPQHAALREQTLIIFPPMLFLQHMQTALSSDRLQLGAQNISVQGGEGAFTGEISAQMLSDIACRHVLVGHSERRAYYGEDNAVVAQKFLQAKNSGLRPTLCVGETLAQYESGATEAVIFAQLDAVMALEGGVQQLMDAVVAYEPVWAIGTGKTASPEQAQQVHAAIRTYIGKQDENVAKTLPILYGGSVKVDNARQLLAMADIDGVLVGGASLNVDSFLGIALCNK